MFTANTLLPYWQSFFAVLRKQDTKDRNRQIRDNAGKIAIGVLVFLVFPFVSVFALGQIVKAENYREAVTKEITYGRGENSVGMLSKKDLPRLGPESFANDSKGNLYICDTVNRRIQMFFPDGKHKFTISLGDGMTVSDIAIDRFGLIYVYDVRGKIYQYDQKGNLVSTINVGTSRWQVRMGMHIINDCIYISTVDQEDVLIGKIINRLLMAPTKEELSEPSERGIHGFSGRRYLVNLLRWKKGEIEIIDKSGATIKSVDLPMKGIVSIKFLQEDKTGNFYIQTERVDNEKLLLEVQKFNFDGTYLTTILVPDNDYSSWSVKLLSLDENGNIYQFLPAKERARLNIFGQE